MNNSIFESNKHLIHNYNDTNIPQLSKGINGDRTGFAYGAALNEQPIDTVDSAFDFLSRHFQGVKILDDFDKLKGLIQETFGNGELIDDLEVLSDIWDECSELAYINTAESEKEFDSYLLKKFNQIKQANPESDDLFNDLIMTLGTINTFSRFINASKTAIFDDVEDIYTLVDRFMEKHPNLI